MEQDRIKDKALYFAGILSMCILLVSVAYFFFLRTIQIDLQKSISLHYTGENGMASLEVEVIGDDLNQRVQEFLDTVLFEVSPNTNLSNGDVITITATYDENLAQRYHYEVKNAAMEITVEGLQDRYASLEQIDNDYLSAILDASETYVWDHENDIFSLNHETSKEEQWELTLLQPCYGAFLKSKSTSASDRVIQIYQLDFKQNDQIFTLYYLVCVPEINDGMEIQTQDIFGERAYLSDPEIESGDYASYVNRVFGQQYQIESIDLSALDESE